MANRQVIVWFEVPITFNYDVNSETDLDKLLELCRDQAKAQLEQQFENVTFVEGAIIRSDEGKGRKRGNTA